jgi:hypothetical protein
LSLPGPTPVIDGCDHDPDARVSPPEDSENDSVNEPAGNENA